MLTYDGLIKFLENDDTDLCSYITVPNSGFNPMSYFVCKHFAEMLQSHASAENIKSRLVGIKVEYLPTGHACVEFETSDKGKVYIDPTGVPARQRKGRTVGVGNPIPGEIYQRQLLFSEGVSSPLGKVSDIFKEGDVGFDQKWNPLNEYGRGDADVIFGKKRYTVKIPIERLQEQHLCTNTYSEPVYCPNFCLDDAVIGAVRVLEEFEPAPDSVTGLERNLNAGYSLSLNQNLVRGRYDIISSEGKKVVSFQRDNNGILGLVLSSNLEASQAVKIPIISAVLLYLYV